MVPNSSTATNLYSFVELEVGDKVELHKWCLMELEIMETIKEGLLHRFSFNFISQGMQLKIVPPHPGPASFLGIHSLCINEIQEEGISKGTSGQILTSVYYYVEISSFLPWLHQGSSVSYSRLVILSYSSLSPVPMRAHSGLVNGSRPCLQFRLACLRTSPDINIRPPRKAGRCITLKSCIEIWSSFLEECFDAFL